MAKQTEVQTLVSITGQAEEDVVEMLKRHGGDMDAATNALMDSECTFATAARPVSRHADPRKSAAGNQMAGVAAIFPARRPALTSPPPRSRPLPPPLQSQWRSSRW